ncbi:hypothetical protein PsYK624_153200 [Phanerochaete sordida]|uniref:Uncharacterized protein n=1 Tax=Phanerochaete sordida TaxID=48140 RepID=A0A9P3GT53_9APHY|nr:hypothetical protein PsYK624_153200 [Phanerochaete sordida]
MRRRPRSLRDRIGIPGLSAARVAIVRSTHLLAPFCLIPSRVASDIGFDQPRDERAVPGMQRGSRDCSCFDCETI